MTTKGEYIESYFDLQKLTTRGHVKTIYCIDGSTLKARRIVKKTISSCTNATYLELLDILDVYTLQTGFSASHSRPEG
jgi:hypothetical protein